MVQSRFWISTHPDFDKANKAKQELLKKNPDTVYQIRKGTEHSNIVFRVVQRLQGKETEVLHEQRNPTGYTIRRSKKQRRDKAITDILH